MMQSSKTNNLKRKTMLDPSIRTPPRKMRIHNSMYEMKFQNIGEYYNIIYKRTRLQQRCYMNQPTKKEIQESS